MFQKDLSSVPVGQLWVEMLRFYSLEFNMVDNVIGVRTKAILSREANDWPKKRMAVEGESLSGSLVYARLKNQRKCTESSRKTVMMCFT